MEEQMFSNLIESSSHRGEYRRRGSFFLFTTASYALLFVIAGVVSIYAYEARLEDQTLEWATIMPLVEPPVSTPPEEIILDRRPVNAGESQRFIRQNPIASVNEPELTPEHVSSARNLNPPIPRGRPFEIGAFNADPAAPGDTNSRTGTGVSGNTNPGPAVAVSEPPPAPTPKPVPKIVRKNVVNGDALSLPKPPYPPLAKQSGIEGTVNVQVLIDEKGNVISASVVAGHPLLAHVARQAAFQARFSPTYLGEQPVKVSGVITYNFTLQR